MWPEINDGEEELTPEENAEIEAMIAMAEQARRDHAKAMNSFFGAPATIEFVPFGFGGPIMAEFEEEEEF